MTKTSHNPDAGLGDAYWYEWLVGLRYVLDVLDPAEAATSVILQKSGEKGLDDVVVAFADGKTRYIQVKHTRIDDSLTFGDLVVASNSKDSLLKHMAAGWIAAGKPAEVWLVTNRRPGKLVAKGVDAIPRPPLDDFIPWLHAESERANSLSDFKVRGDWNMAWNTLWLPELNVLASEADKLAFLRAFRIQPSEPDQSGLHAQLLDRIRRRFQVRTEIAERLLRNLYAALRKWATSNRGHSEAITKEAAYAELCLTEDTLTGDHDFPPPGRDS